MSTYTLQNESRRIFDLVVGDERLNIPDEVKALTHTVKFVGNESQPFFPVPYKCAEAQSSIAGVVGLFANAIGKARYGIEQEVEVDVDHAMLSGLAACFLRYRGSWLASSKVQNAVIQRWDHGQTREPYRQLGTNIYQTKDSRWFHTHGSMNPTPLLKMLGLPQHDDKNRDFKEIVEMYMGEVKKYDAETLDNVSNNVYRIPGTICYEEQEFLDLPHGKAVKDEPYYRLTKEEYYTQPPAPWPEVNTDDRRPLTGIKVLDLSRAIAAPTIGKFCAALGATVIKVGSEVVSELPMTLIDGCTGKICVDINLKTFEGRLKLMELIKDADVFVDGYRPAVMEHLGFGRDSVLGLCAKRDRGIIYVQENCYGWEGPWSTRAGWAQIADCVSGISLGIGRFHGFDEAQIFPGPNADYLTGHAGVVSVLHALIQRNKLGGSYVVKCSLLASNMQLLSYGRYTEDQLERLKGRNPKTYGQIRHYDEILSQARIGYTQNAFIADRTESCLKEEFYETVDGSGWGLGPIELVSVPLKMDKMRTDFRLGVHPPGYHLPQWDAEEDPNFKRLPKMTA